MLFTFSPVAIYYSTEGRMYAMVWFFAASLAWSSVVLAERGPRAGPLLLWVLSGAAGLLTHYFFAFVWVACATWLLVRPGRLKRAYVVAGAVLTLLAILPWYLRVPESLSLWRVTSTWLAGNPPWWRMAIAPAWMVWRMSAGWGPWGGERWGDWLFGVLVLGMGVLALRSLRWRLFTGRRMLLWMWLAATCFGPLVFDLLRHTGTSNVPRYAIAGLPAAMVLLAFAISRLGPPTLVWASLGVLFAWATAGGGLYNSFTRQAEAYRAFASDISDWARPSDLIVVHSIPSGVLAVTRYLKTDAPVLAWVGQLGQRRGATDLEAALPGHSRVAMVRIHHLNEPAPEDYWLRWYGRATGGLAFRENEIVFFTLPDTLPRERPPFLAGAGLGRQ
jgi:hypothetical protein